jgi:hypothetical protein
MIFQRSLEVPVPPPAHKISNRTAEALFGPGAEEPWKKFDITERSDR